MSRFSAVVVLWFSTEAAEAALLLFDRFIAIEKKKLKMILEFPVKFSVEIKTKTWALIGRSEIYAGKQSKQN